jgi:ABC-2 type transport system ATP-binding protein
MTPTPAVQIRGLVKKYPDKVAVDGLDLDIHSGEVFALLGPNGAGKTTTVEILEGYRKRDAGEVSVLGVDPGHASRAWRDRIGIVGQTSQDAAELTVEEIVRHFALFYSHAKDPDEVITVCGLEEKRRGRIRSLSGGQRRRLDVALGIVGDPELLFLDEPTTGFDPTARRAFWELVRSLSTDGTTILLTTHYLDEAEELADRVGVINNGTLIALDTPERLGDRQSQQATVRWLVNHVVHEELTDKPTAFVNQLAADLDGEVPGLEVIRPTLEDIYLTMISDDGAQIAPNSKDL